MGSEFLLEIGCEEVPARFLPPALLQIKEKLTAALTRARINFSEVKTWGTPRRLAAGISEMDREQAGGEEKRLGPLTSQAFDGQGAPTKAALGFARSCGVEVEDLDREMTPKGEKLRFVKKIEGRPTREVLPELLPELIKSLDFPKAMRWGAGSVSFVRPVHWMLAILDGRAISFDLDGLYSGNRTRGHRFTHPAPVEIESMADYFEQLDNRNVIADPDIRQELIEREVARQAEELGGELFPTPGLLEEVTNLVEFPVVISGRFDQKYLKLPAEVLVSAMRAHQRYFAIKKPGTVKELLPNFITVANTPAPDLSVVIRGNERVLAARLADAEFYWQEDLKTGLEKMREQTAGMIFYKTLGTYLEKMARVENLCAWLADKLFPDDPAIKETAVIAARYSKADLVCQMVSEFPDLQGIMGGEYARAAGQGDETARAISHQYFPRSSEDIAEGRYPCSPAGDVLSLADKMDSVVACWCAGLAPTGAGDPFALRRQGQGVISLILARGYRLNLKELVRAAADLIAGKLNRQEDAVSAEIADFLATRFRVQLTEAGLPYDVVEAGLAVWNGDLLDTRRKIEALARMKAREDFEPLMIAFRRVMNIIEGEPGPVLTDLFIEQSEATLYSEYTRVRYRVGPLIAAGSYDQALDMMRSLRPSVDRFFEEVLVNTDDQQARKNRHALCFTIAALFREIADFSKIVIEGEGKKSSQ